VSEGYRAVGWTPHKRRYDLLVAGAILGYVAIFVAVGLGLDPNATVETQLIRALGTCALLLLHVVLAIGPLTRLDRRFLPLLYNRRHLGVALFTVALGHATFAVVQFHALSDSHPLVSLLVSNTRFESLGQFPFEALGLLALLILFAMAATSHDFWLRNLTPPVWKSLHMLVYVAYALIVLHVALGTLQAERHPLLAALLGLGLLVLVALHVMTGQREVAADLGAAPGAPPRAAAADGFVDGFVEGFVEVCGVSDIHEKRARIVTLGAERIAVFRYDGKVAAISNVCQHQNGPLGEGKIIDGCVTCPWHGYQYLPETGASPPPFTEKVATFEVRVAGERVLVHPRPNPPGTPVEPAACEVVPAAAEVSERRDELYIGYLPAAPPATARFLGLVAPALLGAVAATAALVAALQGRFDPGVFEYGRTRTFEGTVGERPYPMLIGAREAGTGGPGAAAALLVRPGKHGAAADVAGLDGRAASLEATMVVSPQGGMLELLPETLAAIDAGVGAAPSTGEELGSVELTGEIVDSKCFLGVMKPGRGKPHRSCAARCISGGIPPQLLVEAVDGSRRLLLLATRDGAALPPDQLLDLVGEPVTARGQVERHAGILALLLDDGGLRRARDSSR
jgi:nitrite reductase/ring-hydroxylating ferredoxin subunit/DMSO/TMAO reductase YedYZ heme-binding membrane subunit